MWKFGQILLQFLMTGENSQELEKTAHEHTNSIHGNCKIYIHYKLDAF